MLKPGKIILSLAENFNRWYLFLRKYIQHGADQRNQRQFAKKKNAASL